MRRAGPIYFYQLPRRSSLDCSGRAHRSGEARGPCRPGVWTPSLPGHTLRSFSPGACLNTQSA